MNPSSNHFDISPKMASMVAGRQTVRKELSVEREALQSKYTKVVDQIDVINTKILGFLIEKMVINPTDKEYISNGVTHKQRNERLLDSMLRNHCPEAINTFILALEEEHSWLARELREHVTKVKRLRFIRKRSPAMETVADEQKGDTGTNVTATESAGAEKKVGCCCNVTTAKRIEAHFSSERHPVESECESLPELGCEAGQDELRRATSNGRIKLDATTQMSTGFLRGQTACNHPTCACSTGPRHSASSEKENGKVDSATDTDEIERQPLICHPSSFIRKMKGEEGWSVENTTYHPSDTPPSLEYHTKTLWRDSPRLSDEVNLPSQVSESDEEEASIKQVSYPSSQWEHGHAPVEVSLSLVSDRAELPQVHSTELPSSFQFTTIAYPPCEPPSSSSPPESRPPAGGFEGVVSPLGQSSLPRLPHREGAMKRGRGRPMFTQSRSVVETQTRPLFTPPLYPNSEDGSHPLDVVEDGMCSDCSKPLRRTSSYRTQDESSRNPHCTCAIKRKDSDLIREKRDCKLDQSREFMTFGSALQLFDREQKSTIKSRPSTAPDSSDALHGELDRQCSRNTHDGTYPQSADSGNASASFGEHSSRSHNQNTVVDAKLENQRPEIALVEDDGTDTANPTLKHEDDIEEAHSNLSLPTRKTSSVAGLEMFPKGSPRGSKKSSKKKKGDAVKTFATTALTAVAGGLLDEVTSERLLSPTSPGKGQLPHNGFPGLPKVNGHTGKALTNGNKPEIKPKPVGYKKTVEASDGSCNCGPGKDMTKKRLVCRTTANSLSNSSTDDSMLEGCYQVVLQRHPSHGFGFKFVSGKGERARFPGDEDYFITTVIPGSPSHQESRLRVLDTIVSVNGEVIRHKSHEEVCHLFRQAEELKLVLRINQSEFV